jgi:LysR family glycine cleavage system transcriptional activator
MPRSLPPLTALRTFEAAARLGSFTRAARELHVTPAAVSHQIRSLEEYLGVKLFRRTTRSLSLTTQAAGAADSLREAFDQIGAGVELMRSSGETGELCVSTTPAFATRWLVDRLGRFRRKHPRIQLRLGTSPSPADFDEEDVDVAVRIGRGGFDGVISVKLFDEWIAPLASPAFLKRHPLRKLADVARVPLLHDDSMRRAGRPQGWQEWLRAAGVAHADARQGTHFDDGNLVLQAAAGGGGLALGRLAYAVGDIEARRLKVAISPAMEMDVAYYLLIPEAKAELPAVVAFRAWMEAEAAVFRRAFGKLLAGGTIKLLKAKASIRPASAK